MKKYRKPLTGKQKLWIGIGILAVIVALLVVGSIATADKTPGLIREGKWASEGEDITALLSFRGKTAELLIRTDDTTVSFIGSYTIKDGVMTITDDAKEGDRTNERITAQYAISTDGNRLLLAFLGSDGTSATFTFTMQRKDDADFIAIKKRIG